MDIHELMEDILLDLLICNVEDKDRWVDINAFKIKFEVEQKIIDKAIKSLEESSFIEVREDSHIKILKEGIDYILKKV